MLTFTLPKQSIDKEPLATKQTIEIYRSAPSPAPASATAAKPPAPRLVDTVPSADLDKYSKDGRVEFPDPLSAADLARTPGQQIDYFVRTRVSSKRASTNSNAVSLPIFPAPGAVSDLRASVAEDAITLTWTAPPLNIGPPVTGYRVYRADVPAIAGTPVPASASATASASPSSTLQLLGESQQPQYRDATAELDHTYSYFVRSFARYGSAVVESADSVLPSIFAKDIFPPAVPQGLEAIVAPESNGTPAYVELAWNINPEADFAGYIVYRSEQNDTTGAPLTPELLSAPTFRDTTVVSGHRYFYRVAAVDHDGNTSALSNPVEAEVP